MDSQCQNQDNSNSSNLKTLSRNLSPRVQKTLKSLQTSNNKPIDQKRINKKVLSISQRKLINIPISSNEYECQVFIFIFFLLIKN
jgi:hypothetical protein